MWVVIIWESIIYIREGIDFMSISIAIIVISNGRAFTTSLNIIPVFQRLISHDANIDYHAYANMHGAVV